MINRKIIPIDDGFKILAFSIMDDEILAILYDKYTSGLIKTRFFDQTNQTILKWLIRYFKENAKAPKKTINAIFDLRTKNLSDDKKDYLIRYLKKMDDVYAEILEDTDICFIKNDLITDFIRTKNAEKLISNLQKGIQNGNYEDAEKDIELFKQSKSDNQCNVTFKSLIDLKQDYKVKTKWIWNDFIAEAMPVMFSGPGGEGKSTFTLFGINELLEKHNKGVILWFQAEGSIQSALSNADNMIKKLRNKRRIKFVCKENDAGIDFSVDFSTTDGLKFLENTIKNSKRKPIAVFIDSLRGCLNQKIKLTDDTVAKHLQAINNIVCDQFQLPLVYLHHFRKKSRNQKPTDQDVYGSAYVVSSMRRVIGFSINEATEKKIRVVEVLKDNSIEDLPKPYNFLRDSKTQYTLYQVDKNQFKNQVEKSIDFLKSLFMKKSVYFATEIYDKGTEIGLSKDSIKRARKQIKAIYIKPDPLTGKRKWICRTFDENKD